MAVAEDTRARILEAAGSIFAEKGYDSATIRDICQRAQANVAAVNYHFGDKQRLYDEAVRQAYLSRARLALMPEWSAEVPPETKLIDFVRTLLNRMLLDNGSSWQAQLMLREISQPKSASQHLVADYIRPHFEMLEQILRELLPKETCDEKRRLIAFSIIGQCLHYRVAGPVVRMLVSAEEFAAYTPEKLAEHIAGITLAAIGRGPVVCPQRSAG